MGLPWETRAQVFSTLAFAFKLAHKVQSRLVVSWLTVFPGSPIWRRRDQWGIAIGESDYDRPAWWARKDFFRRTHPGLTEKDGEAIVTYLQLLKTLFPGIRNDGLLKGL
jgi:hypothetical protein